MAQKFGIVEENSNSFWFGFLNRRDHRNLKFWFGFFFLGNQTANYLGEKNKLPDLYFN